MVYYKMIENDEHMLYAKEIAEIYSNNDKKFTSQKVSNIINGFIKENKLEYEQLYFETRHGLCKVYPYYLYSQAMKIYIDRLNIKLERKRNNEFNL